MIAAASDDENHLTPKGFLAFIRDGCRYYIKKASLLLMMATDGKRVSTDRIYRFTNDRKQPSNDKILIGDFVVMTFKGGERIFQIIVFKFLSGKAFFGDDYIFEKGDVTDQPVMAFCNLFYRKANAVAPSNQPQELININEYKRHVFLKRDISTRQHW